MSGDDTFEVAAGGGVVLLMWWLGQYWYWTVRLPT